MVPALPSSSQRMIKDLGSSGRKLGVWDFSLLWSFPSPPFSTSEAVRSGLHQPGSPLLSGCWLDLAYVGRCGMKESMFGCLFPRLPPQWTACLQKLFSLVEALSFPRIVSGFWLDGQNPSLTCHHDSAWVSMKDDSYWLCDIVSMNSPLQGV